MSPGGISGGRALTSTLAGTWMTHRLAAAPLVQQADVRLHPNWTSTAAASASDAAIIITSTPIGWKVGWFRYRPPGDIRDQSQQQQQQLQTAEGLSGAVSEQQLTLHIAGYPDNKVNGSMWQQCCTAMEWQLQGNLLWHDCYARGGNSGSPIWVVWPSKQQQQGSQSDRTPADWDCFQAVGIHSSSLKFLKDSQVGVYADELYAQAIARAQQRQAAAAAGQQSAVCSASTSSFSSTALTAAAANSAADASARSQSKSIKPQTSSSPTGSTAGPVTAPTAPQPLMTAATGAGPAGSRGGSTVSSTTAGDSVVSGVTGSRALLAGAGGREGDGDNILLPVAVPFTGDTYERVVQVLREFEKCPGE